MHSLAREGRYAPLALKSPWLGKKDLAIHQLAVSCSNCLALFNFLVSVSPFHLSRNFPSFLLSCLRNVTSVLELLIFYFMTLLLKMSLHCLKQRTKLTKRNRKVIFICSDILKSALHPTSVTSFN